MSRRQPEDALHGARLLAVGRLPERGWLRRFPPRAATVGGAIDRRPEVPGLRGHQENPPLTRVLHDVVDDVAEKLRPRKLPAARAGIGPQREGPLAGADPKHARHAAKHHRATAALSTDGWPGLYTPRLS